MTSCKYNITRCRTPNTFFVKLFWGEKHELINNCIEWHVPFADVTVKDFIKTHSIDNRIIVDVDNFGGASDDLCQYVLQAWTTIKPFLDGIGYAFTVSEIFKIICRIFGKNKKKIPSFSEFKSFIWSKTYWPAAEIDNIFQDAVLFEKGIMELLGYEKHEGGYWKNEWKAHMLNKQEEMCRNEKYSLYEKYDALIVDEIDLINQALVYLSIVDERALANRNTIISEIEALSKKHSYLFEFDKVSEKIILKNNNGNLNDDDFSAQLYNDFTLLYEKIMENIEYIEKSCGIYMG